MKNSLLILVLFAAACSRNPEGPQAQKRIDELEQQNAQLQHDLLKAKNDVASLQRVLNSNANNASQEDAGSDEGTPGQPTVPQPANGLGGGMSPPQQ